MSLNAENKNTPAAFLDDLERQVSEIFSAQKSEVEQSLAAKINREKEEAQKRIEAVNREFSQVRGLLDQHKASMASLESTEQHLRGEIRGHFERAVNYQKMMENAAALAGDELEKIGGLNQEIEKIRIKAEHEYATLKNRLDGYAGIAAQLPEPAPRVENEIDWIKEIGKLRQVRDLMATLRHDGPAGEADAEPNGACDAASDAAAYEPPSAPAAETAEELAASLGLFGPDDDPTHDDLEFALKGQDKRAPTNGGNGQPAVPEEILEEPAADSTPIRPEFLAGIGPRSEPEPAVAPGDEAQPEAPAEAKAEAEAEPPAATPTAPSPEDAAALEGLSRYRQSEPVVNGTELVFYATEKGSWLDALSFMAATQAVVENARQLHAQLTQTTSVKDLFLLKQEILNQQEVLRKLFFRIVRFCDKDGGHLPASLGEVINSRGMKDVVERLTMANWSDPSDFKPFLNELNSLKRAFEAKTAESPCYLQAALDEIEAA
jgi:hypothetical protein